MDNGEEAGLNDLTSKHQTFSLPIVVCILTKLFNLCIINGHIPESFRESYTVPISKCEGRSHSLLHDFRRISICCINIVTNISLRYLVRHTSLPIYQALLITLSLSPHRPPSVLGWVTVREDRAL